MITERDLPASTARDDNEHSPSKYINAESMARRLKRLNELLDDTRAMDPSAPVIQGGRSSNAVHNLRCERVDIYWVMEAVQCKVTERQWEAWEHHRRKGVVLREIPKTNKRTAARDIKHVDALIDTELDDRDMLGDWR